MGIGDRLKEERERLGFNQTEFAAIGQASKNSQYNYEKGERSPDAAYLAAVAEKGVDILYVVTGERRLTPSDAVLADEWHLLEYYRDMAHDDRQSLVRMAYALAKAGGAA
ncbi:helix-turn-helix transcriptional regulator [Pseudomonas piscis]|uniref:Helix-turn-helix transcriptional regulator n=1 Tax=Pseudomonas piscis TaxID=2614538 RepID=A0ABY9NPY5_9PSED|nr:helix-turn-helix transcriptional regulator [Pseudomonas piscis]WMN19813.1 helix-turn-helix transcriptional regulator [Pseudomonas piscis]